MIDIDLKQTMEDSFLEYSAFVIRNRAIPDARDCLKYSARQLLYSQFKSKLVYPAEKKKAQVSVGEAMKEFYVHGDAPCYGTFIRMAKPFALRYPLEEVKGNLGTLIDSNSHSQARYVEMRGSELTSEFFTSLNKDTIDEWRDNYDQSTKFPLVLPSIGFYNIVNGCTGIATGISTSVPQFNLREVNAALVKLLNNPNATFEELYCPIDFATGATIINEEEVKESLKTGNGKSAKIRAKIEYNEAKHQLIVTEMPYSVYTNTVCGQLQELIEVDANCGIENFLDATGTKPCLKINLTKKAVPVRVVEWLYKNTSLQNHYSINMIMLDNGKTPRLFGWKEALESYLAHMAKIMRKDFEFDVRKIKARLHILDGYLIALANITEVVEIIKKSSNTTDASLKLITRFDFSEIQTKAILDLKLSRLVNMESIKIEKEKKDLIDELNRLENILATQSLFNLEMQKQLERVGKKYGDARRTTNMNLVVGENNEPVEKKTLVVYFSEKGTVQAQEANQYAIQMRGGRGSKIKLRDGDFIKETIFADNGSWALIFTSLGKAHTLYLNDLEVGVESHLQSILSLEVGEQILSILPYNKAPEYDWVLISTKNGYLKKTLIKEYIAKTKKSISAIKLRDGDTISSVSFVSKGEDILVVSSNGNSIIIGEDTIPLTGRQTMGVQGIKLDEGNNCLAAVSIKKDSKEICSITTNGLIKRTAISEFNKTGRATKGVVLHKILEGEKIASVLVINDEKELLAISTTNTIRISLEQVPKTGRSTQGVSVMKSSTKITKIVLPTA